MTALSIAQIAALYKTLSASRMGTFDDAVVHTTCSALDLYAWNANVSAALLAPLHICEVSLRNAVSEALEVMYGQNWPWDGAFRRSLPNPSGRGVYSPRRDIVCILGDNANRQTRRSYLERTAAFNLPKPTNLSCSNQAKGDQARKVVLA